MYRYIPLILLLFAMSACSNLSEDTVSVPVSNNPVAAEVNSAASANTGVYTAPEWANMELINAITGESFTFADLAGKTVFIEPMATWCTNCRAQQGRVAEAMASLGTENFVFISMSVEYGLSNETLAEYAARNGFPQTFVVGSAELLDALVNQFGRSILNPPSTPHFIISPNGTVSSLSTGAHSVEELANQILAAQNS